MEPPIRESKLPIQVFYGWWLVGITLFSLTFIITPIFHGLGFFFVALERQFGWSRAVLSVPFSLGRIEGAILGPIEGYLTDRLGSRRMILIGFALLGAAFILFSFIQGVIGYYVTFLLIFAGAGFGGFIPLIAAINNWFRRHRTKAMAIGLIGINLGALLAPLMGRAMDAYGWRAMAISLGISVLVVTVPIARMVRNRPEEYGQHPDGDPSSDPEDAAQESFLGDDDGFTVGEALRTTAFWAITAAHGFSAVSAITISVHIIPAMTDIGMSLAQAGTVVLIWGVAGSISQLGGGFLGDRLPKRPLISIAVAIQGAGILIAATIQTIEGAYLFALLYGIGLGARVPLLTAIRGDYFGRRNFASILGVSQMPMNLFMVGAPILAGYFFDILGSYTIPFLGLAILNFLGAGMILLARQPILPSRH
ncbi:MFS transporter [SAR202 cluster bacterium AC-647-N09_OGT_505m]|nr:MFS transporter [SAR202 cluster bacterium AC-647-N09_OGT_505m]